MSLWHGIGLFLVGYLVLLARSAFLQGEGRQFLTSLGIVAAVIAGLTALAIWWSRLAG